jgi:hypothetical protein
MRSFLSGIVAAFLLLTLPSLALADAAGTAKGVKPDAAADRDGAAQTLVVGSDIFINDIVQTGPKGQVQILFADNTKLVVGPSSKLKIEDYLIRNDGSAGKLAVDMLAGSFRFATGNAAKNRYIIDTPTGTIGVRGTRFDVFVFPNGVTRIMHYLGVVRFCTKANVCEELSDVCTLGEITNNATILGNSTQIEGDERNRLKHEFIYADNQSPLLSAYRFAHAYDCLHNPPVAPDVPTDNHGNNPAPDVPVTPPPITTPPSNNNNNNNTGGGTTCSTGCIS